jgi:protein-S-isoprenylcysteine O-methyltransferase Ste14
MRSFAIVALQLSLIVAIMLPFDAGGWSVPATALVGAGIAVGMWALTANRPGNFNIRPEVKPGGRLVTGGPYAYVRHPMYLAVMLAMPGFCLGYGTPWRWAALAALGIVLAIKIGIEEKAMAARHPDYAAYARNTKRIVPFVW